MKSKTIINAVLPLLILFSACFRKNPSDPVGKGYLAINLVPAPADSASIQKLDSVRCIISKDGSSILDNYLSKVGTDFQAQFEVEPGTGYAILLYGMEAGVVAYRGNKNSLRVTMGKTTSVPIAFSSFQVILVHPLSGSARNDNTPAFRWRALPGAVGYALQASISSDFTTLVINQQDLTTTTFAPSASLSDGNYHWRVRGKDNLGNWGSWSSIWNCTIKTTGPPAPTLTAPVNGTETTDDTPTFSWNAASGAGYQLQVSASNDFATIVIDQQNLTTTSYTPSTSLNDGIYYWRARAKDNLDNWGNWSEVWSITIQNSGPPAPTLTAPINESATTDNTPTFSWNAATDATGYQLQASASHDFATLVIDQQNLVATSYTPSTSLNDGIFYWRARAKDNLGNWGNWSEVWSIKIQTNGPPAPTLIAPVNGTTISDNTPAFSWNSVSEAIVYQLQVSTSSGFTILAIDRQDLTDTTYSGSHVLNEGASYYWRVRAKDNLGTWGVWSDVWNFKVTITGPPSPILNRPANGFSTSDMTPTFSWDSVIEAASYELHVSTSSNFTSQAIAEQNLTNTNYVPASSLSDSTYYWRVRAKNNLGNWGQWSAVGNFKVMTRPALSSPSNGSLINNARPAFNWNAASDVIGYEIQVSTSNSFTILLIHQQNLTYPTYTASEGLSDATYYWRVRNKDLEGNWGNWSSVWVFTMLTQRPPAPNLIFPENNVVTTLRTPTYVWNSVSNAIAYRIQVSTTRNFESFVINEQVYGTTYMNKVEECERDCYEVPVPLKGGIHYWRVQAQDRAGNLSNWSTWSFTVTGNGPGSPSLVSPSNNRPTWENMPTFRWGTVATAVRYELRVSADSNFVNPVINQQDLTNTSYTVDQPLQDGKYYWMVRAYDASGVQSGWSATWNFIVDISLGEMIIIPAGWFSMGSNNGNPDEQPVHSVYLNEFYIDKYEVTNAQYKTFCDATRRNYPPDPVSGYFLNYPNYPVVNITWEEARIYAAWVGKRLPTEAEWEKASRGGLEGKAYPWGDDDPSTRCNYLGYNGPLTSQMANLNNGRGPLPKGSFTSNDYGLYGMVGNVAEWCNDFYEANYYASSPDHDPQGPASGTPRVCRGGSWNDANAASMRCADRFNFHPGTRNRRVGFRCARTP